MMLPVFVSRVLKTTEVWQLVRISAQLNHHYSSVAVLGSHSKWFSAIRNIKIKENNPAPSEELAFSALSIIWHWFFTIF